LHQVGRRPPAVDHRVDGGLAQPDGGSHHRSFGGSPLEVEEVGTVSTEDMKLLYRQFVEALNRADIDGAGAFFADDYVEHSAPPDLPPGAEGVKIVFRMFRTAFPDVVFTIDQLVAENDRLATVVTGRGTHQGPFMGIEPTGRRATWVAFGVNRYEAGKIREHWGLPDIMGIMRQLGPAPVPAGQPAGTH
jgi:predicted ester cyclase